MRSARTALLTLALSLFVASHAAAQSGAADFRDEIRRQFESSARKITALAEAMPESKYGWSPMEGTMTVGQVYMHIARYNFYYPATALGIEAPSDIDVPNLERITDKTRVLELLDRSIEHVRGTVRGMTEADLTRATRLYRRDVAGWSVLLQLVSHMNEHVGQSVSYARMNGIVPPWSS